MEPQTEEAAVRLIGVGKDYPRRGARAGLIALKSIDFEAPAGSITGVIGRSGAGKSTLVRLVNGLERPSRGRVFVGEAEISALSGERLRVQQRRIGMVFQHFNLLSSRSAADNVALPMELAGAPASRIQARVKDLLEMVGLQDKARAYPAELSGGQKQRVGVARALAMEPNLLLCDEATSALDPETTIAIIDLLRRVNQMTGVAILMITHEMHVVKMAADRVVILDGGEIAEQGDVYEIFANPKTEAARALIGTSIGAVPETLARRLTQNPCGRAVWRVLFTGARAQDPTLTRLARNLGLDIDILSGQIEEIAGRPFAMLIVATRLDATLAFRAGLEAYGLKWEALGYVAD